MSQTGPSTIQCPSCGTPNPIGSRFCGSCGSSLERACPSCSATVPGGFRFCGRCGSEIADGGRISTAANDEERKVVSVLFADLAASTELATRLDPEDLREVYRPYFESMAEEIVRHGGTLEKFIGDAVVGVFGAPVSHGDDPVRAVRAALAMQNRFPELNERLAETAGGPLSLRVAVETGEVVAARGAEHEGLVTGETTTIASRLQAVAPTGGVVVGERTHRVTERFFEFDPMGRIDLKGLPGPIAAWRARRERQSVQAPAGPFVGRRDETELLGLLLRRCAKDRRPYVATIVGPAGMGKSRLAGEFVGAAERGDVPGAAACRVVRGRCLPYGEGLRLWPLAEILKADIGVLDSDPLEAIVRKARRRIDLRGPNGTTDANSATLLSSLGVAVDPDPLAGADRDTAGRLITGAWSRYLALLASDGPLVAVVEDIHWADDALLELLEKLATRTVGPLLLVCLARSELFERRPMWATGHANFATIELAPLSDTEDRALVEGLFDSQVAGDVAKAIVERAEGNPFFTGELVRMLVEDGNVVEDHGVWKLAGNLPTHLPDTVQGAIAARIDRLPSGAKRAIQDAAVVGRTFWPEALEVLGSSDAASSLDTLIERNLVIEHRTTSIAGSREMVFQHALIRDVAYASITRARREEAHGAFLGWIESVTRGRDEEFAELIAHHAEVAGDAERTVRYAMLAGHRHRRAYAAEEAVGWYERALGAIDELPEDSALLSAAEVVIGRGEALEQLGRFEEAEDDFRRALEIADSTGRAWLAAQTFAALGQILWRQDRHAEADALLPKALEAARDAGAPDVEARLLSTAGEMASDRGDWVGAVAHLRRALDVAEGANDLEVEAYARHGLAGAHLFLGPLEEAYRQARRAIELWTRLGQRPRVHNARQILGHVCLLLGRLSEADEAIEEALEGHRELGQRREEPVTLVGVMLAQLARGDLGPALASANEAVVLARAVAARRAEHLTLVYRALLLVELADTPSVVRDLTSATDTGQGSFGPVLVSLRGLFELASGERDEAIGSFRAARHQAGNVLLHRLLVGGVEIRAWEETSDADGLRDAGRWLLGVAEGESPGHEALARSAVARADLLAGNPEAAREGARIAAGIAERADNLPATWRACAILAEASRALREPDEAEAMRRRASEIVRAMIASIDGGEQRRAFSRRRVVAALLDGDES